MRNPKTGRKKELQLIIRIWVLSVILLLPAAGSGIAAMTAGIVGSWGTGRYQEVAVGGHIACCAASGAGVDIIDISSPAHPVMLSNIDTTGSAVGVCLLGTRLYVAAGDGCEIIDISNPRDPVLVSYFRLSVARASARHIEVHDDLACIAAAEAGLVLFDVSRPGAPTKIGVCPLSGYARRVVVKGDLAYVAIERKGMQIVDIRDPRHPVSAGNYETDEGVSVYEVAVDDEIAILACNTGVQFVDISHPATPRLLSEYKDGGNRYNSVWAGNRVAYLGCSGAGLRLLDFSHPAAPVLLGDSGLLPVPVSERKYEYYYDVEVAGTLAFLACNYGGLRLVDISNLSAPAHQGSCSYREAGSASALYKHGSTVCLARPLSGIEMIDVSDPQTPIARGWYRGSYYSVSGSGDFVYAGRLRSLDVLDVSNPATPVLKGQCDLQGVPQSQEVVGQRDFVTDSAKLLEIIDLSDAANPRVVSSCDLPDRPYGLCVKGSLAYIACGRSGLQIVDLKPATPVIVGRFDTPSRLKDVEVAGNLAFLADISFNLLIVDISNPRAPVQVGSYKTLGAVLGLKLVGNRLYLSSGYRQGIMEVLDVSDPVNPVHLRAWDLPYEAQDFEVDGEFIHVADGDAGCLLEIAQEFDNDLYFPHAACSEGWQTEIALVNPGATFSFGKIRVCDQDGRQLGNRRWVDLYPWGRWEHTVADLVPASERERIAYIVYETGSSQVVGYLKFSQPDTGYRVALPAARGGFDDTLYVSHVASSPDWWTGIALVSTREDAISPVITFSDGRQKTVTLAAGAHQAFSLRDLYGSDQPGVSSAVISNCRGVVGLELFGGTHCSQLSGITLSGKLENTLYYPHVTFDPAWWTGLVAYDPGAANHSLLVTPYDETGRQLNQLHITPQAGRFVDNVVHMGLSPQTAWLQIEASSGPITGFELFGSRGEMLGGYTGVGIMNKRGILPKIDQRGWTGIALMNPHDEAAGVILEVRTEEGVTVTSKDVTLAPHARLLGTPAELFPEVDLRDATYIDYRSDRGLVAFQLNGDGVMLDALPALGCR